MKWDDGGGREAVFVSRQFSLRNAIPPRSFAAVGPPDRRSFAAAVDQTDAANAVGQCASGVSGRSAVPQQDTDRNAMKTLPSVVSPDWRRQGPIDDKSSPSEAYANSAVM